MRAYEGLNVGEIEGRTMDTVSKVGLQSSMLSLTHQSNLATSGAGAPDTVSGNASFQQSQQSQQSQSKTADATKHSGSAVDEFLSNLKSATMRLRISQDDALGIFVYQSVDPVSGEVQGQYPSKERLQQLAFLADLDSKKGTTV
jgi:uncharacterized FlaG/YvyC family protein